ncbi:hypothetical protein GWN42_30740 [candidate division KSB1 bacterium]|nr:hypothetical protein [candidate division KSB1 bacterium]
MGRDDGRYFDSNISVVSPTTQVFPVRGTRNRILKTSRPGYPLGTNGHYVSHELVLEAVATWKKKNVTDIVCLLTDGEQLLYYGFDLADFYKSQGFHVHYYPVPDHKIMRRELALQMAENVEKRLKWKPKAGATKAKPKRILFHCSAGIGRTNMAVACLLLYLKATGFIKNITATLIPQTAQQTRLLDDFPEYVEAYLGTEK